MPSSVHRIDYFDIASDLDTVVICLGLTVLVFKLSTYFTLNKEHLNPRFVHELADKLVVRQCHGRGISYEEDEDNMEYGLDNISSWHKQRSKLLHMMNEEQVTIATKGLKWYQDPSILYEERVNTISNHGNIPVITGLSSLNGSVQLNNSTSSNSYVDIILPMASQKVAKESNHEVVAMVLSTPSTVMVYYGDKVSIATGIDRVMVKEIIACSLENKDYCNCK